MRLTRFFVNFFENEKAGGLVLVFVTCLSLLLANIYLPFDYIGFWHYEIGGHHLSHWINDGLMTIFFLLIGLELEREIYNGELSKLKNASLPIIAAIGGMIMPAAFYLSLNYGTPTQDGAGIPMATDIAFAIGILSLLGNRVPASIKVFLTALAIIDDLGAIIIIAVFYSSALSLFNLGIALSIFAFLLLLNRLKVHHLIPYFIGGFFMWYFMLHSGVHATITGVLLAFAIPFGKGDSESPSHRLQHFLHLPVAFIILPLFAMANTCIAINSGWHTGLLETSSLGIILGLVFGKPIGITLFAFVGVSLGLCALPDEVNWKKIISVGFLGGIGFTMSIFITILAFDNEEWVTNSKIAILLASFVAGLIGFILLKLNLKPLTDQDMNDLVE